MAHDSDYTNVLLEDMRSQIQTILEITLDTREQIKVLPTMQEDIADLKQDVATIKIAVTDTNKELKLLERRVTKLEKKVA